MLNEREVETKISFLSPDEREKLRTCNQVNTDFTFEIYHHQSSPLSKITYFNLLTYEEREFVFHENSEGLLQFDGYTLTCYSNENKCQSLGEGDHTPVVIISFCFQPQIGYKPSWKTLSSSSNKFSIRGSYHSITCAGTCD